MKNNDDKRYLFRKRKTFLMASLLFFCVLVAFYGTAKTLGYFQKGGTMTNIATITVAVPDAKSMDGFDPAKIQFGYQYLVLLGTYSTLFEHDYHRSEIVTGLAESFSWKGTDLIVHLKKGHKTKSGYEITAYDVEQSFKRLIILNTNTHGDLGRILCNGSKLERLQDDCPGISVLDKYLVRFSLGENSPTFIRALTSIDFAVVPMNAVDKSTLKIIDYSETSGPMYYSGRTGINQLF